MTDRPILFSGPMVRALLDGQKTQTRRVITAPAAHDVLSVFGAKFLTLAGNVDLLPIRARLGDRLWVREAVTFTQHDKPVYRADARDATGQRWSNIQPGDPDREVKWRPSIHMPRWASRLTLTVTDVRVQRLQEIDQIDAFAEGIEHETETATGGCFYPSNSEAFDDPVSAFRDLWDGLNAPRGYGWDAKPWVCALTFTVHRQNIDQMGEAA